MHTGPAEWWQIVAALGPLAVLLGALIAGVIGWRTLKQKAEADNRAEWWKRTQWALDAVYSGDKKRGTIGLKVLKVLGESELAGDGELAVLEAASERPPTRRPKPGWPAPRAKRRLRRRPGPGRFSRAPVWTENPHRATMGETTNPAALKEEQDERGNPTGKARRTRRPLAGRTGRGLRRR